MINIVILDYSDYSDFKGRGRMLFFLHYILKVEVGCCFFTKLHLVHTTIV